MWVVAATRTNRDKESVTRTRLIEATAALMREEGYAAATSRRVAERAGVRSALVYYYFDTMDDLFVAVLRAGADAALDRMRQALHADDPLQALWEINSDARLTVLNSEFVALANHRKVVGVALKAYAERVRDIETAAAAIGLRARGIDLDDYPPVVVSMVLVQMSRSLSNESAIGVTAGHRDMIAVVDRLLGSAPEVGSAT